MGIKRESKFSKFLKGYRNLKKALAFYEASTGLRKVELLSYAFLLMGFFTLHVSTKIAIVSPAWTALVVLFEFMASLILTTYCVYKRLIFIKNYDLECNPRRHVKMLLSTKAVGIPLFKYVGVFLGTVLITNVAVNELRGVSVLREFGENYIDGGKSFKETAEIIKQKVSDGYKSK